MLPKSLGRRLARLPGYVAARDFLTPPPWPGVRLTWKRLLNLYLVRYEHRRGRERLRSLPIKLTVEPTNICNLRCPGCFTGVGEIGRPRGAMPMALFEKLLDELGDYLFSLELANWGEPLLNKNLCAMIRQAHERGISTTISTHFSLPFDAERAEELVASGLSILGVSIDGVRQQTYQQYRVRGDLQRVLQNCRLVADAKRRLESKTPRLVWEFHVFEHNAGDVAEVEARARELDMEPYISKGWTPGEEWDPGGAYAFPWDPYPDRCVFLWQFAVVNNDGGVAPCCGTFYREDDLAALALDGGAGGFRTFREAWNGPKFLQARRFYRDRTGSAEHVCYDCPQTTLWERWQQHRTRGGTWESFDVGYTTNDSFHYFFERRPSRVPKDAGGASDSPS
jgi:pyruvate-formate lyase-activating enzyme